MARHRTDRKTCFSIGSLEPIIAQIIKSGSDYYGVWDIRIVKEQDAAQFFVSFTVLAGKFIEISTEFIDEAFYWARGFQYYYRYTWEEATQAGFPGRICDILKSINYTIYLKEIDYNMHAGTMEKCHINLMF